MTRAHNWIHRWVIAPITLATLLAANLTVLMLMSWRWSLPLAASSLLTTGWAMHLDPHRPR
jgi:hypothetical protein